MESLTVQLNNKQILLLRKSLYKTQSSFGKIIAKSPKRKNPFSRLTVFRWESGFQTPSIETMGAIINLAKETFPENRKFWDIKP